MKFLNLTGQQFYKEKGIKMEETIDFRLQIRTLLVRKKSSIAKLARKADLSSNTVYRYLKGTSEISAANLTKLFNTLNSMKEKGKG